MNRVVTSLFVAVLVALGAASGARAFYVEARGPAGAEVPVRFADADDATPAIDVEYRINLASLPTGVDAASIEAAMATWSGEACANLSLSRGEDSESVNRAHWMNDAGDRYVLVYFTDSNEEWTGGPSVGHYYFAHDGNGVLIGATVVLNTRDHTWSTDGTASAIDVQGTVTALVGRALGITSAMEGNATFPRYAAGDLDKRSLGADDAAALAFLYPDASCATPMEPEAECDGIMLPGEPMCPPRPQTNPGDGGTNSADAGGPPAGSDAGPPPMGADGGVEGMTMDGGCSASTPGRPVAGLVWVLIAAAIGYRRRR